MIGINSIYRPVDEVCIPEEMDENLVKYDVNDIVKGEFKFEVVSKDAKTVKLHIHEFSCSANKRIK